LAISDIEKILVRTERDLYQGRISETKARAFKGLADSMLKYFDAVDLHERLSALEQR